MIADVSHDDLQRTIGGEKAITLNFIKDHLPLFTALGTFHAYYITKR
jgi:hypothetical protein